MSPNLICSMCVHLNPEGLACAAFPAGIPKEIREGESLHLRKRQDDRGLQFQLADRHRETAKAMVAEGLFPEAILRQRSRQKHQP